MGKIAYLIRLLLQGLIKIYRFVISPILGHHCRFYPSCSQYAQIALEKHGLINGIWLGLRRLVRCHPWCPGGYDPVPDKRYKV